MEPYVFIIVGISAFVLAVLFIKLFGSICVILCWWRRRRTENNFDGEETATAEGTEAPPLFLQAQPSSDHVSPSAKGPRRFTYSELAVATDNFSESRILGRGGFGAVYKGCLDGMDEIAVKRIAEDSKQGRKEFLAEVSIISETRHRNLVKLRGWCEEADGRLFVVYDYHANGSVDGMLFDDGRCGALTWKRRMGIARGVGAALQYLHEACERAIVHRDVKASNVLLDEAFVAKLGDFGLSRRVREGARGHTTVPAGTLGYLAPEIFTTGKATTESDMYSFGVVLAELATGRTALLQSNHMHPLLVDWVRDLNGSNRLLEAADHRLAGRFDAADMQRLLHLALACSHPEPACRPSASDAVNYLLGSLPLPSSENVPRLNSIRWPRRFTFSELAIATDNFSESRILGRGGSATVYKGCLDGTEDIAVKRIAEDLRQGMKEFVAEVSIISEIRHRNLVKLRGWCQEEDGRLFVVYDYHANGSVDGMLFDERRCGALTWERRMGIARGVGAALQYLHEGCERVIVHRDVKASNVLLDEGFVAKLGDFGLSRRVREGETGHTTRLAGTFGYMAPEIFTTGRATTESDVYSFGALLAELATGRTALLQPNPTLLVDWVWALYGSNRLPEAADHRLDGCFDVVEMERLLIVALACSHPDPARRPTASDAVNYLLGTLPLPTLPSRKPSPTGLLSMTMIDRIM